MNVLFRPIAKKRPNWGYFETEPDTGLFLGWKRIIGDHIGPEWEDLPIAGSGRPRGIFGEPEIKKERFVLKSRSSPDNQTTGISFAVFIFNRHLCREMPNDIRLRSDRVARPKKSLNPPQEQLWKKSLIRLTCSLFWRCTSKGLSDFLWDTRPDTYCFI